MNRFAIAIAIAVTATVSSLAVACSSAPSLSPISGADETAPAAGFTGSSTKNGKGGEPCATGGGELSTGACPDEAAPASGSTPGSTTADAAADAGSSKTADASPASSDTTNAGCSAGMVCKPGSIRYCDSKIAEWTKSTCDAAGNWGPCVETTAPSGPNCDPNSYSPEKCCPGLELCCQDETNGPFVDYGSGACAAVACK